MIRKTFREGDTVRYTGTGWPHAEQRGQIGIIAHDEVSGDGVNVRFPDGTLLYAFVGSLELIPPPPYRALLAELREECRDWQEALCGGRDGLDELCQRVDAALGAAPAVPAFRYIIRSECFGRDDESRTVDSLEELRAALFGDETEEPVYFAAAGEDDSPYFWQDIVRCLADPRTGRRVTLYNVEDEATEITAEPLR